MMDRRRFLLTSVAGVLAAPLGAEALAQTRDGRPARVGILIVSRPASDDGLKAGLHGLGYVEGKTVVYELRSADNQFERLPDLAAELVGAHVDVIFAAGTATATAAARVSSTVPIVFAGVADPIASGLAESLARPGKNASGLTAINVELVGKRIHLLKEAVPTVKRIGFIFEPADPSAELIAREMEKGAEALHLEIRRFALRDRRALDQALGAMRADRVDAFIVFGPLLPFSMRLAEFAFQHRLPAMADSRAFVEAGLLMAYGVDYQDLARQAAGFVDLILKGARISELPIQRPTRFELILNLKTAKALGLTTPPSLLARADQVIE